MSNTINNICIELEKLSNSIKSKWGSNSPELTMTELWGWNCPPLNLNDIKNMSDEIINRLKALKDPKIDDVLESKLNLISRKIDLFIKHTATNLFNGNGASSILVYLSLIEWIEDTINPLFEWVTLKDTKILPKNLSSKLQSINVELDNIITDKEIIEKQLKIIEDATLAAEHFPLDLETLKASKKQLDELNNQSSIKFKSITDFESKINKITSEIAKKDKQIDNLLLKCEEVYKITTTQGLAKAFDTRAGELNTSMWGWVFILFLGLIGGIWLGSVRFEALNNAINNHKEVGYIWIQIFLSVLSFGAPIWLAWVATKQINQRFKLAEDYAFKASIAKTYEGYRREAANIDSDLEEKLFSSTLKRFDEAPLRLTESEHYNSPLQEFMKSKVFKDAMEKVPNFGDVWANITKIRPKKSVKKEEKIEKKEDKE